MTSLAIPSLPMLLAVCSAFCLACERPSTAPAGLGAPVYLDTSAGPNSLTPDLFVDAEGRLFLSWQETDPQGPTRLLVSQHHDGAWGPPRVIAEGSDWFVNWADFPTFVAHPGGPAFAHVLQKSGAGTYAYDIALTASASGIWRPPFVLHDDGTPTEHGFVSMVPWGSGGVFVTWLDGRMTGGHGDHGAGGAMTLRAAFVDADGNRSGETVLDERVCDCCQTAAAATDDGLVVAYRDRSAEEVRDLYVTRYDGHAWSTPRPVHNDGWQIAGCPVNGPAIDARERQVLVAWFTAAGDRPTVRLAHSADGGATFGTPLTLSEGTPVGRVDVRLLAPDTGVVTWIEGRGDEAAVAARLVRTDGGLRPVGPAYDVAPIAPGRASGFPRIAHTGDRLYLAWTEVNQGGGTTVRTSYVPLLR